ncbi:hypothetical protein V6U81_12380 [Micromonospora sp. CPCC 205711]|uniref:hypothetical protein n=1 Tax=Micromonospora sp. CPCC 205547 TaxID=3122400 RepID=UPI002FEF80D2
MGREVIGPALVDRLCAVDGVVAVALGGSRIYRDLDRVRQVWADCRAGRYSVGVQAGHPLGFYSHAYAGEVELCRCWVVTKPVS